MCDEIFFAFQAFSHLFNSDPNELAKIGNEVPIPTFSEKTVKLIFSQMLKLLLVDPKPVVHISSPCYVVGDIHGNLHDLIRIFSHSSEYYNEKYVFLGDYVDRGSYSLEILILLFTFKLQYPNNIILLRGNHEFPQVNSLYGFKKEMNDLFGNDDLYNEANELFSYFPLAAVIDNQTICLHGGIGPNIRSIHDIENIIIPTISLDNQKINEIVWSDPSVSTKSFRESERGQGYYFGLHPAYSFLKKSRMNAMIRAHQCVANGLEDPFGNCICMTVFSSSNYGKCRNSAGFLYITKENVSKFTFSPLEIEEKSDGVYRAEVCVKQSTSAKQIQFPFCSLSMSPSLNRKSQIFDLKGKPIRLQKSSVCFISGNGKRNCQNNISSPLRKSQPIDPAHLSNL